jgi:hypothetical protein
MLAAKEHLQNAPMQACKRTECVIKPGRCEFNWKQLSPCPAFAFGKLIQGFVSCVDELYVANQTVHAQPLSHVRRTQPRGLITEDYKLRVGAGADTAGGSAEIRNTLCGV